MKTRLAFIDILKTFAIFLVIWGHCSQNYVSSPINDTINHFFVLSFHMPLFAFLSGLFFSAKESNTGYIKRKAIQLLFPLMTWCFLQFVCVRLIDDFFSRDPIHLFAIARNFYYGVTDWGYWFLRALFFCFLYLWISLKVRRIINNRVLVFLSILFLWVISWLGIIPNKYHLLQGFIFLYPFFSSGYLMKDKLLHNTETSKFGFILSLICFIIGLWNWQGWNDTFYDMNTSILATKGIVTGGLVIWKTIFRFFIGLTGSLTFFFIFKKIYEKETVLQSRIIQRIADIGKYTLGIYIIQSLVFENLKLPMHVENVSRPLIIGMLLSLMIFVFAYFICKITYKIPYISTLLWGQILKKERGA